MVLYKYRNFAGSCHRLRTLNILKEARIFCAPYNELNDPFEGMFWLPRVEAGQNGKSINWVERPCNISEYLKSTGNEPRICSFSANPWDIMMWGLYAASSKGIVIEIVFPESFKDFPMKVDYDDTYHFHHEEDYDHNGNLVSQPLDAEAVLLHKSTCWKYEEEYRVITDNTYLDFDGCINRVIIGPNISQNDYDAVKQVCPSGCELVEAEFDFENQIVYSPIHPDYQDYHDCLNALLDDEDFDQYKEFL